MASFVSSDDEEDDGSENLNEESDEDSMMNDSAFEYSDYESEYSTSDSYVYPWPTSSDDSWASVSSDDAIQKILLKLPTYDPQSSEEEREAERRRARENETAADFSDHGDDSAIENDEISQHEPFSVDLILPFVESFEMARHPEDTEKYDADDETESDGSSAEESGDDEEGSTSEETPNEDTEDVKDDPAASQSSLIKLRIRASLDNISPAAASTDIAITPSPPESDEEPVEIDVKSSQKSIHDEVASKLEELNIKTNEDSFKKPVKSPGKSKTLTPTMLSGKKNDKKSPIVVLTPPNKIDDGNDEMDGIGPIDGPNFTANRARSIPPGLSSSQAASSKKKSTGKKRSSAGQAGLGLSGASKKAGSVKKKTTTGKSTKKGSGGLTTGRAGPSKSSRKTKSSIDRSDVESSDSKRITRKSPRKSTQSRTVSRPGSRIVVTPTQREKESDAIRQKGTKNKDGKVRHRDRRQKRVKRFFRKGDLVEVQGMGNGILKYAGIVEGVGMFGIELTEDDAVGEHNGTYKGKFYFEAKPGKGVLVEKALVSPAQGAKRKGTSTKREKGGVTHLRVRNRKRVRNNAQLFGDRFGGLFEDRIDVARRDYAARAPKKLGPRDVGRVKNWKGGDVEYGHLNLDASGGFLEDRVSRSRTAPSTPLIKKAGPRDVGDLGDWKPPEYEVDLDSSSGFLGAKPSSISSAKKKALSAEEKAQLRKAGPRDVGGHGDWKPAQYDVDIGPGPASGPGPVRKGTLSNRKRKSTTTSMLKDAGPPGRKTGPRDVGGHGDWKPSQYDVDIGPGAASGVGTSTRTRKSTTTRKKRKGTTTNDISLTENGKLPRKDGPRDVRKASSRKKSNWTPAKYDVDVDGTRGGGFLDQRTSRRTNSFDPSPVKVRKEGPRDIGRAKYNPDSSSGASKKKSTKKRKKTHAK